MGGGDPKTGRDCRQGLMKKTMKGEVDGWRSVEGGGRGGSGLVEGMIGGDGGAAIWQRRRRRRPEAAATGRLHADE